MSYSTLIQPDELARFTHAGTEGVVLCDCRFDLANPAAGARDYAEAHIPGAHYLDLEAHLSGARTGRNGRHPLPERADLAATLARLGGTPRSQFVAYDAADGMFAARLWWLIRWLGHAEVAVLDGGFAAWRGGQHETEATTPEARAAGDFTARPPLTSTVAYRELGARMPARDYLVLDARAPDRFRGENETLDPVGGHIPGAHNRFFRNNLDINGRFKPPGELRAEFLDVLGRRPPAELVSQCGSGVTACHNLLALEIAGLPGGALYPGSWSEWVAQPDAPLATGAA